MGEMLAPLRHMRVWRFSLYYVVVFGAYVGAWAWLPTFYKDTYGVSLRTAALLTATYILPASLLRPLGGCLSDRYGQGRYLRGLPRDGAVAGRVVGPVSDLLGRAVRLGPGTFATLMFVVGCGMGIGKASVYKYIPDYFPDDVGAVGGLVGMLGALGGFFMPPAFGCSACDRRAADGLPLAARPDALEPGVAPRRSSCDCGARIPVSSTARGHQAGAVLHGIRAL